MKRNQWVIIGLVGIGVVGCGSITEPSKYIPDPSRLQQQEPQTYDNPCGCPRPQPHGKSGDRDTLNMTR